MSAATQLSDVRALRSELRRRLVELARAGEPDRALVPYERMLDVADRLEATFTVAAAREAGRV